MLARNFSFSTVISLPQPSQTRCEWLRKYPIGFDCPVPQVPQTTWKAQFLLLSPAFKVAAYFTNAPTHRHRRMPIRMQTVSLVAPLLT
jgi:hypothetical protein